MAGTLQRQWLVPVPLLQHESAASTDWPFPTGTTCSTTGGQTQSYAASYDAWGNMTTRTATGTGGTTANLTYDGQDHLVRWNDTNTTSNEEWYLYDASGQRVLRRSQQGGASNTTLTVYAFGLEEHQYSYTGSGSSATNTGNTYYYSLGGHLIGTSNGTSTSFLLTDALGSVVSSLSNTANSAVVNGNQTYGPYGNQAYSKGTVGTNKGYTGQYNDALTQLDYYGARYYDPLVGGFLSADKVQGNFEGMNPYNYVGSNPETRTDPTGQYYADMSGNTYHQDAPFYQSSQGIAYDIHTGQLYNGNTYKNGWLPTQGTNAPKPTPYKSTVAVHHSSSSFWDRLGGSLSNFWHTLTGPTPLGEADNPLGLPNSCGALSFAPMTKVATLQGEKAIGSLDQGERVWAYNPKTHKMELKPVLHVWINHDNDLVDVTIASTLPVQHGKSTQKTSELLHTNQKHPFLTIEKGFIPVSQLHVGMHVVKADGGVGVITALKAVAGAMTMYNLEVEQDHTFTVGEGEWIVHNCGVGPVDSNGDPTDNITMQDIMNDPYLVEKMTPEQVANIARGEGWVVGPLKQSQHGSAGISMNQPNARGTSFTDQYVQYHEGGGYHGDAPYWKISSAKGGTVRIGPQFSKPATEGDINGGDITDFIDP